MPPPCPHLPAPEPRMSHRCLTELRGGDTEAYYLKALQYGHYLWLHDKAGRALLALARALYADLPADAPVLAAHPLPYAALHWIVVRHHSDDFPGNPRISFQHQATRLRGPRAELRRARAWALWALVRDARPGLPPDKAQAIREPTLPEIEAALRRHGHPAESALWRDVLAD
ncbi:MAG: hypothetical protein ACLFVC_01450 [Opitutales bacterium]